MVGGLAIVPPSIHAHMDNRRMHDDHRHDWNEHFFVPVPSAIGDNAAGSGEECDDAD
jgi:hypothetical protein